MAVKQKDIASYLNIDPSSVSYALKGGGSVSQSTRRQVQKVARKMGYRPNLLAKGMRTGKTGTIGMLAGGDFQRLEEQFRQIETAVRQAGFQVLMGHGVSNVSDATPEQIIETELSQLDQFIRFGVDGLIIQSAVIYLDKDDQKRYWDRAHGMIPQDVGVVVFDSPGDHGFIQMGVDRHQWGHEAGSILRNLGYEKLLYIGSKDTHFSRQLYQGLQSVAGLKCQIEQINIIDRKSVSEGYRTALSLQENRAQVLVAANALIAHGLLVGLLGRMILVPQELSLIALDRGEILQWPPKAIGSIQYQPDQLTYSIWKSLQNILTGNPVRREIELDICFERGETVMEIGK